MASIDALRAKLKRPVTGAFHIEERECRAKQLLLALEALEMLAEPYGDVDEDRIYAEEMLNHILALN